jgi:3-hydroxy-9,10-secoandrosta-1,3,5(10)-triene-9,17-dione monooxygenase reductase component
LSAAVSPERFRFGLGHLPTGVTVLTAYSDRGPVGMAANSITSVSLDPPLILVCPAKSSESWPAIRGAERFCANVMARHHEGLVRQFARKGIDRFAGVDWHERSCGPALDGAVAWIQCRLEGEHDAGDHTIAVASVEEIDADRKAIPLVFFRGRYGAFRPPDWESS